MKTALIFGVANEKSIAWAVAKKLFSLDFNLGFSYLGPAQEKRLKELLEPHAKQSFFFPCDVSQDESIFHFFKHVTGKWRHVDALIHSVAYTDRECLKNPFHLTNRNQFSSTLDISAYSLIALAREALPLMTQGGSVISMSYYGAEKVIPHYNIMGVAKSALECATRYLASDLGSQNIRVNAISAGPLRTLSSSAIPGIRDLMDTAPTYAPLKRNVDVMEVAEAAVSLIQNTGITGEILHVDCGLNIMGMGQNQ